MATLNLIQDIRRVKRDGTFPLVFRVRLQKKSFDIGTGYSYTKENFDPHNGSVKNDFEVNYQLEQLKGRYLKRMREYLLANVDNPEIQDLKDCLLNKPKEEVTISEFWDEYITILKKTGKLGNAKVNEGSKSVLEKIINLNTPFAKFNYKELIKIENTLLERGVNYNSIGVYLRSLRKICNDAIKHEYTSLDWYPFRKYQIKKEKTSPRVLSIEELQAYFRLDIKPTSTYYKSYLIGKLIFMMRGINLRDLLSLTNENIKGERIFYKRSKTGTLYSIKLTEEVKAIFAMFTPNKTLLGILEDNIPSNKFIDYYHQRRKVINSHLSKIGKQINSREKLSTYCFRYSFANVCKQLGFSKDLIAEALGHQYGSNVTGIYLEQYDLGLIDEMTAKTIEAVS